MHFICPHCHAPIEAGSTAGEPVVCPSCGSSFPLTSSPTVVWNPTTGQRRLGRFELIDRVGTGAFSNVYKALDTELERIVAIKVPRTLCIDDDNGDRNRFSAKVETWPACDIHPSFPSTKLVNTTGRLISSRISLRE